MDTELKYNSPFELLHPELKTKLLTNQQKDNRKTRPPQNEPRPAPAPREEPNNHTNQPPSVKGKRKEPKDKRKEDQPQQTSHSDGDAMVDDEDEASKLIEDDQVTILRSHTHEVFICAWSPSSSLVLASG
jgi:transducin (beta)-like 1